MRRLSIFAVLLLLTIGSLCAGEWNGVTISELNGSSKTGWNATAIAFEEESLPHVADANARLSLVGISPGYQVIQDGDSGSGAGVTYTYNGPSSALTAAFINSDTVDATGIWTKRGTLNGKDYYNLLGESSSTSDNVIYWGALGGILGTGWGFQIVVGSIKYYSNEGVTYPWQVVTWIPVLGSGTLTGNVASMTTGEVVAGMTITGADTTNANDIYKITAATQNGRNEYKGIAQLSTLAFNATIWNVDGGKPNFVGDVRMPSDSSGNDDNATIVRNDIAALANWTPSP